MQPALLSPSITMTHQLLDLPEEILLPIMKQMDPTSLQCLRRTSRIFLRLFSDRTFRHWHYDPTGLPPTAPRFPWLRGNPEFEKLAYDKLFRYLLQEDKKQKQCMSCRITQAESLRKGLNLVSEYLFCRACLVDHPVALFSPSQRENQAPSQKGRTCIGHKGYVRLCQHKVITWKMVSAAKRMLSEYKRPDGTEPTVMLGECRHPGHLPGHHSLPDKLNHHPIALLKLVARCVVLDMTWIGHLNLPSCHGTDKGVSAEEMASHLHELRGGAAEFLVPQAHPGPLPEMRCFDPNNCSCLDFGDKYPPNAWWSLHPSRQSAGDSDTNTCCRVAPSLRLIPPSHGAGGGRRLHSTKTVLGEAFGARNGWKVEVENCNDGQCCLGFKYSRRVSCTGYDFPTWRTPISSWFEALDPDSYQLRADQDTKGTLWCLDASCTNYLLYSERPMSRRFRDPGQSDFYVSDRPRRMTPSPFQIQGVSMNSVTYIGLQQKRIAKTLGMVSTEKRSSHERSGNNGPSSRTKAKSSKKGSSSTKAHIVSGSSEAASQSLMSVIAPDRPALEDGKSLGLFLWGCIERLCSLFTRTKARDERRTSGMSESSWI